MEGAVEADTLGAAPDDGVGEGLAVVVAEDVGEAWLEARRIHGIELFNGLGVGLGVGLRGGAPPSIPRPECPSTSSG